MGGKHLSVLSQIIADVRADLKIKMVDKPLRAMKIDWKKYSLIGAIENAKKARKVPVIAEIKRASPSAGDIRPGADPLSLAQSMLDGGAIALSVLTEQKYFKGEPGFLRDLRKFLDVPLLRKDFIVGEYQVYESASELGADAILLIAKVLGDSLPDLLNLTRKLGMEALVEVADEKEIELAVDAGARLIGINNRDLETLEIDMSRTARLAPLVPNYVTLVSESGIETRADVQRMLKAGADAVLVGTSIMRAKNIEQKVRELVGG